MIAKKLPQLSLTILLLLLNSHSILLAQSELRQIRFLPARPPDRGTPPKTRTPGSRGDCIAKQISLTNLVGSNDLELTVNERPTFWVYVPYTPTEAPSGEFSLQDQNRRDIYRTPFNLPATPGIVSISLPLPVKLEIGQKYRWYFKLNCPRVEPSNEPSTPEFVTGKVERVVLNSEAENQLKSANTALERIAIYAKNGIWYETITELAQLRLAEPQNVQITNEWVNLLQDVRLEGLAREPIAGSIKTNFLPTQKVTNSKDWYNPHLVN